MDLKFELDRIYEMVYTMNEANEDDKRILIAGFEDAINEGIGKWLGKVAGKVAGAPSKIGKAVKKGAVDLYNKGKELGNKAVSAVKDFFKKTGEKISSMLDQWGTKIKEGWAKFTEWCKSTYDKIGDSLVQFWQAVKDKSEGLVDTLTVFWLNMKNKLRLAYESTKKRFVQFGGDLVKWVTDNWDKLKEWSSTKYEGAMEWLRLKYDAAIEALRAGKGKVADAAKWIATWLAIKPYTWIAEKIKRIPEIYKQFKVWLEKQAMEFKLGFEETAGRPFDRAKGFIIPPTFPDVNVRGQASEEEEVTSTYDAGKDPFSLGENNDWKKLGLPKVTKSGKNNIQNIVERYYELQDEGLSKNEIVLSMGSWMLENYKNSGVVTGNSEQNLVVRSGEEKRADELQKRIDAETDKGKITLLRRELRSLQTYDESKVDEDAIGKTTIDVIERVMEDPRISLYLNDASDKKIEAAIDFLSKKGMLDSLTFDKKDGSREVRGRDLERKLKDNGFTDKAVNALTGHLSTMPKKRNVMPLPEMQFEEGMKYIMTFEGFINK